MARTVLLLIMLVALLGGLFLWFATTRDHANDRATPETNAIRDEVEAAEPELVAATTGRPAPREDVVSPVERYRIHGVVFEAEPGAPRELWVPSASATVRAVPAADGVVGAAVEPEVVTGDDGSFTFAIDLDAARTVDRRLEIDADDEWQSARVLVEFEPDENEVREVVLVRYRRVAIRGRAVDPAGIGVAGVRVHWDGSPGDDAISDAEGWFELASRDGSMSPRGSRPGWILVDVDPPERKGDGTWADALVVLARSATIVVVVEEANGAPVPNRRVFAGVSPAEPHGADDAHWRPFEHAPSSGETDEKGRATIENVPAGMRLRIAGCEVIVHDDPNRPRRLERDRAAPLGRPIIVDARTDPDEDPMRVWLVYGPTLRIHGRVLEPDGSPSRGALVSLLAAPDDGAYEFVTNGHADESGRFEIVGRVEVPATRVAVLAEGTIGGEPSYSPFGGRKRPDPVHGAVVTLEAGARDELGEMTLELEVLPEIRGRIEDTNGDPVRCAIRIEAQANDTRPSPLAFVSRHERRSDAEGRFRFPAMLPGRYDLIASTDLGERAIMRAVAAGSTDVTLRVEQLDTAVVRVEVSAHEALEVIAFLKGNQRVDTHAGGSLSKLGERAVVTAPVGWPPSVIALWSGGQQSRNKLGTVGFSIGTSDEVVREWRVTPGFYWFGARGRTQSGVSCFPAGIGPVRIDGGEHVIQIQLVEAGSLEGRVVGATNDRLLSIALVTDDGKLVSLPARRDDMESIVDLSASGRFELRTVPSGTFDLWVGHPADLAAGRPWKRTRLDIEPGITNSVDVE